MNRSGCCKVNRKGFTLLEMICVLAVSSIILLTASAILMQTAGMSRKLESADTLYLNGSFTIDYIEREVKSAMDVYSPEEAPVAIANTRPIGFSLKINDVKYITYARQGGTLRRYTAKELHGLQYKDGIAGNNLLADNLISATSVVDREQNTLSITLEFEAVGRKQTYHRILELPERDE